jgi:hypothetical protein
LVCWLVGYLAGWFVDRSVGLLISWRVSCFVDMLVEGKAKAEEVQKFIKLSAELSTGIPLIYTVIMPTE